MRVRAVVLERIAVFLAPIAATAAKFWNGFVFDDVFVIERGRFIHDPSNLPRAFSAHTMIASSLDAVVGRPAMDTYRPLPLVSFISDSMLSGREPWAYHLSGSLLHGVVCLLLYALLRKFLDANSRLPLLLALSFGLAPWLAEAHVFINGRSDVLLALFVLAALLVQRGALERASRGAAWLAGGLGLCALLSKETAVFALPFIAWVPLDTEVPWRRRLVQAAPLAVALLSYLAMRALALQGLRTHSGGGQLGQALSNLPLLLLDGAYHALLPSPFALRNLRDDYASLPGLLPPLAAVLLVAAAFALLRWRRSLSALVWSLAFAFATLAPATMVSTELWPGFGRYLYVPALGFNLALGLALQRLVARYPPALRTTQLVLIALLAAAACWLVDATLALRDERTMYARSVARAPEQAWTLGFLGLSRKRDGRCDEAIPLLGVASTMAPDEARYAVQLGRCLLELGKPAEALPIALRGREQFRDTRLESAFIIIEVLARRDAVLPRALLERCVRLDPNRADCNELLQRARSTTGSNQARQR